LIAVVLVESLLCRSYGLLCCCIVLMVWTDLTQALNWLPAFETWLCRELQLCCLPLQTSDT